MPGRSFAVEGYRYGFNGKEFDSEWKSEGNAYDYGFRVHDARLGRWLSVDPLQKDHLTPYQAMNLSPIITIDPDGRDGKIVIKGNTIIISSTIYVYGSGASPEVVRGIQDRINSKWNSNRFGDPWKYESEKGEVYDVVFDVKVKLHSNPESGPAWYEPNWLFAEAEDNFVELVATPEELDKGQSRSRDDTGQWRAFGRNGAQFRDDDSSIHEFGHLLGLGEKYNKQVLVGRWEDPLDENGNIMARWPDRNGVEKQFVNQPIINYLVGDHVNKFEKSSSEIYENEIHGSGRIMPNGGVYDNRWSGKKDRR